MKEIPLSKFGKSRGKYTVLVDSEDYPKLISSTWNAQKSGKNSKIVYACKVERLSSGKRKYTYMHRQVTGAAKRFQVDHIDGNGLNNQKSNLRVCTVKQNMCNQRLRSNNTSGFKGVYRDKRRGVWTAQVKYKGIQNNLGSFVHKIDAAVARDLWAKDIYGDFASLNFN